MDEVTVGIIRNIIKDALPIMTDAQRQIIEGLYLDELPPRIVQNSLRELHGLNRREFERERECALKSIRRHLEHRQISSMLDVL